MAARATIVAGALVAALVGGGSALWLAQSGFRLGGVSSGPWTTSENVGSVDAGLYLRAGIAVAGLLALNKSETVYYTAYDDSDGSPLRSDCTYLIEGTDPPARWWSITAYGADHFLIPNERGRYAVGKTNVVRDPEGRFRIGVGGPPQDGNWLATGDAPAPFSLTLRLYNPEPAITDDLGAARLPAIRRVSCG